MANYQYVIDSHFNPFSMQEMLLPFTMYKDAYEKAEEAYTDLSTKADQFKYLSETLPEDSKARQIYEGYANGLAAKAKDLARNGLSMGNRRALADYKRRYAGEIGQLASAQTKLDEELKLRRATDLKDPTMLYNTRNLSIDDFLGGNNPNLYGISGNVLYTKGATVGKAISSRIADVQEGGNVLGGYYRMLKETRGVPQAALREFMNSQVVRDEVDAVLAADGVLENLSGRELEKARYQVMRGIYDGVVYEEKNQVQRDYSRMTPEEIDRSRQGWANLEMQRQKMWYDQRNREEDRLLQGILRDANGNPVYKPEMSIEYQKSKAIEEMKARLKGGSGSSGGGTKDSIMKKGIRISWKGNDPAKGEKEFRDHEINDIASDDNTHEGTLEDYENLPAYAKRIVDKAVGDGNRDNYNYYIKDFKRGFLWGFGPDTESVLEIIPRQQTTRTGMVDDDEANDDLGNM